MESQHQVGHEEGVLAPWLEGMSVIGMIPGVGVEGDVSVAQGLSGRGGLPP